MMSAVFCSLSVVLSDLDPAGIHGIQLPCTTVGPRPTQPERGVPPLGPAILLCPTTCLSLIPDLARPVNGCGREHLSVPNCHCPPAGWV
mmetsp:Transcript_147171/g.257066  ORF Transcript_147171/g.257066 Transcript_147171/m.257066 type:complete len:89 (+) Transcript_147171:251-517(+)